MRAAVITEPGGPGVFRVQEVDDPKAGPEDVLVDVKASALNRADLLQREGKYPAPPGVQTEIPGLEFSGVVIEAGERVLGVAKGDKVFGLLPGGGYASRVVTHHRMVMPMPANMDFVQAAAIPEVFFTAYDALFNHCELIMGESVLIHAIGSGVGTAALQLAHHAGAYVYGTASSADKLAKAAELGLDVGINYKDQDFAEIIREKTNRTGVNVLHVPKGKIGFGGLDGRRQGANKPGCAHAQTAEDSRHHPASQTPGRENRYYPTNHEERSPDDCRWPNSSSGGPRLPTGAGNPGSRVHGEQRQLRQDYSFD